MNFTNLNDWDKKNLLNNYLNKPNKEDTYFEWIYLINIWCFLENYKNNIDNFNIIEEIVNKYFFQILKKLKLLDVCNIITSEFLKTIISFSIFRVFCETTTNITYSDEKQVIILIEFIDNSADLILNQCLIGKKFENEIYLYSEYNIKMIVLEIIKKLALLENPFLILRTEDYTKIITSKNLDKNKELLNDKPFYKKILVIEHDIKIKQNLGYLFKLCLSKPSLLSTFNNQMFLITKFPPFGFKIIKQHSNRPSSIQTEFFNKALLSLSEVNFIVCRELINKQLELIKIDREKLIKEIPTIASGNSENLLYILNHLNILVQNSIKHRTIKTYIAKTTIRSIVDIVNEYTHNDKIQLELNYSCALLKLKKKWDNLVNLCEKDGKTSTRLQQIFSRFYQYYIFELFSQYINENELENWYFLCYSDFRGRFYYNSLATPQSTWCFRHIYICNDAIPDINSYFQAIGFLFKKELVDEESKINLSLINNFGKEKYKKYINYTTKNLVEELIDLSVISEFQYYLFAINKPSKSFFIWKDTTCSMAQHAVKLLGYKEDGLKYLNLKNQDYAYDTYGIYITELKNALKKNGWKEDNINLMSRSLLKHVIMTIGYGVTYLTAFKRHKKLVIELIHDKDKQEWFLQNEIFKEIFLLLSTSTCENKFYLISRLDWIKNQNIYESLILPDLTIPNIYFKHSIKLVNIELGYTNLGKRIHHQLSIFLNYNDNNEFYKKNLKSKNILDNPQIKRSIYVNTIHAYDAYYMRNIVRAATKKNIQIIAVHDGFAISTHNTQWLLSSANLLFNLPHSPFSFSNSILL